MADFSALKQSIQNYIKQNGNKEITGNLLQNILLSMVTTMGDGAINDNASDISDIKGDIQNINGDITDINGDITNINGNITDLNGDLSDEINRAEGAEGTLQQNITAEENRAKGAETTTVLFSDGKLVFKNAAGTVLYQLNVDSFLNAITTRLNTGALYAGYATPSTTPAALTSQEVFYLATQAGTYTNFHFNGGDEPIVLTKDGIYFIVSGTDDDDWNAEPMLQLDDVPTALSNNPVKSGGVAEELALGAVYDVSAKNPTAGPNNDGKWESLSALLSDANLNTLIPTSVRKGGMSVKFVSSVDNKYVQYRLMPDSWSIDTDDWSFCGNDVYIDNPEWTQVVIDNDDRILYGVKKDGNFYFGNDCPPQIQTYVENYFSEYGYSKATIDSLLNNKVDKVEGKSLIDAEYANTKSVINDTTYYQVTTDNEHKILEGITSDGYKEINIPIKTPSFDIEHKGCLEWLDVKTDNEGRILRGTKSNGVYFFGTEIESPTIDKINEDLRDLDDRTDELSDTNIPFFPFVKWGRAWPQSEKKSNYEAWPFANCFYDASTGDICVAINEREKHSDTNNTGCVWFRKKKENKDFGDWILISNNLDGIGKRTHATGLCGNGDYISFIIFQEVGGNGLDGTIHLFRSTDKGDSWTDEGAIQIDGASLQSDQVSGLYLMESGRLITASHKGSNIGTSNTFVMYSDDNGLTWTKSESSASVMNTNDQECSWCEIGGTLFMVTRRGYPYLYYSEDSGVTWVYSGRFNFENNNSPTSITKLPNGKYLVIGGNRAVSQNGEYPILSSIVDEAFFTKGQETPIAPITLIKFANTQGDADYSYTQAVITANGMLYCYYYDRSKEASTSPIVSYYELKGTILGL